jgi:alpha-beta hydrolase superfamily lysophospholipase
MITHRLLNALLFFPTRRLAAAPARAYEDLAIETDDGERLHGWWVPAREPPIGHVLLCHGNGGNVGDRVPHVAYLTAAGLDVLAFDYRGYGRSTGRASESGTYRDARAARRALIERAGPERVIYLGESLGAAVALELAHHHPPAKLILQSPFTSIRDMARLHYPVVPRALVPDAYPSLRLVVQLDVPLLVLHGERDDIVPLLHGEELYEAATCPKRLITFPGAGHNELVGREWADAIAAWARE